jgi:membrane protein implicated in regulation of membrane protease activity
VENQSIQRHFNPVPHEGDDGLFRQTWYAVCRSGDAFLLGAELLLIDAQFYLVFVGAAALLVGALGLGGVVMPDWLQWLAFAGFSIASMILFRNKLYELLRRAPGLLDNGHSGEQVIVPIALSPGESCRLEFRGSTWTARNTGEVAIASDSTARIVEVEGLTLQIQGIKRSTE